MRKEMDLELMKRILITVCINILVGLVVTLAGISILSWMISSGSIPVDGAGYGITGIIILATACAAIISSRAINQQRLIVCICSGLMYYLVLIGINALLFSGQYKGAAVTAMLIIGTSTAIGFLGAIPGGRKMKSKSKFKNR